MTMLSDEELGDAFDAVRSDVDWVATEQASGESREVELDAIRAHIDALTAQRDRARDIAVSLEQELAEVADLVRWRDNQRDPGAGQVIAEFDAVAKVALRPTAQVVADNATGIRAMLATVKRLSGDGGAA